MGFTIAVATGSATILVGQRCRTPARGNLAAARPADFAVTALAADASRREHYQLTAAKWGWPMDQPFKRSTGCGMRRVEFLARFVTPSCIADEVAQTSPHPGYLDGGFQLLVDILRREVMAGGHYAFVPVKVGRMTLLQSGVAPAYACGNGRRGRDRQSYPLRCSVPKAARREVCTMRFRAVQLRTRR